ncbi:MAG: MurR/RpiR family transcriptional regulator [Treponemataceae bacterium]
MEKSAVSKSVPGCLVRINALYSQLRESEKKVADYIRLDFEKVIHQSITEVAETVGASESTVVRLCKALDYRGFQDFKIHLAQEYREPASQIHEAIGKDDDALAIKKKVFESDLLAITETLKVLADEPFLKAVILIAKANRLEFYGTGGSGSVAMDAQHKFLKIGKKSSAHADADLQAMSASLLGTGDVAVGISHSGGNKEVLDALEIAKKCGASVIAITNYGRSPITKISDVVLFTAAGETAFKSDALSSRIAELVILDALWTAVAFEDYDRSSECIRRTREATASKKI